MDSRSGDVVCSLEIPGTGVTNMAFGRCPNEKKGKLVCLYVTTATYNISSPTFYNGRVLLIRNTGSEGVLPNRAKLYKITD